MTMRIATKGHIAHRMVRQGRAILGDGALARSQGARYELRVTVYRGTEQGNKRPGAVLSRILANCPGSIQRRASVRS